MPTITLRNAVEGWVSTERASKFGDTRLYVHSTANAYLYFTRPKLPAGAVITNAILRLWPGQSTGVTSGTINVHHLTSAFDPASLIWTAQPTVGSLVSSLTRTWYNGGASMDFSVTAEVQAIVNGGQWFGWRISSATADATQWFGSSQSGVINGSAMELVIDYQAPPPAPTDLYPNSNRQVNSSKPTLSWVSQGGQTADQLAFKVQVAADSAFTTSLYTSNEIASAASSYDLNVASPTFTALTAGQSRYWRVQVKNSQGVWSNWSNAAQFTYVAAFAVTITAPSGATTADPTPTVTWTYTGTQQAYQVLVRGPRSATDATTIDLYDSGIKYGTTATMDLPVGVILWPNGSYQITVRVWATTNVVSVTGTPSYDQSTKTVQWVPSGATPSVQLLVTQEVAPLPARLVRWQYTGAAGTAARFILTRSRYGLVEASWDLVATAVQEGATQWYRYVDRLPAGRADVTYEVMTVSNTRTTSTSNPTATVHLDHQMPIVVSVYDPTVRAFSLLNYQIDSNLTEVADVIQPVNGPAFVSLQRLGKYMGSASGEISWDAHPGNAVFDGEDMRKNFMWIRQNPRVYMVWADQAIEAIIWGTQIDPISVANGKTDYAVSFNFVEV